MQDRLVNAVPTLPRIIIVPDANPGRRGISSVAARPRAQNSTTSTWNVNFCDCCCSVSPTYCCIVTCCTCTTIASAKESLGGCYERTLLYFGGLAFGFLVSVGFASNSSNEPVNRSSGTEKSSSLHESNYAESVTSMMWKAISAVFLMAFLFGVWKLRLQTRHSLGIRGSHFFDCLLSFCCCFCVVSQLHLELKYHYGETLQHNRRGYGDYNFTSTASVDTLAPYAAM